MKTIELENAVTKKPEWAMAEPVNFVLDEGEHIAIVGRNGSGKSMLVVLCLALGTVLGELIGVEDAFERFGEWLKKKTGNEADGGFVNAFVTASLTVSIGAMAIVGSIQDGVMGDYSTLAVKAVLDFIIVLVMASSMGKGCAFSAIPVFVFEGGMTLLARLIAPVMTDAASLNLRSSPLDSRMIYLSSSGSRWNSS